MILDKGGVNFANLLKEQKDEKEIKSSNQKIMKMI